MIRARGTTRATMEKFWNAAAPLTPRRFSKVKMTMMAMAMTLVIRGLN